MPLSLRSDDGRLVNPLLDPANMAVKQESEEASVTGRLTFSAAMFPALQLSLTQARFLEAQDRRPRNFLIGLVLSLLLHIIVVLLTPKSLPPSEASGIPAKGPLVVKLSPRSEPALSAAPPPPEPTPAPKAPPPRRVIAAARPNPTLPPVMPVPPEPTPQTAVPAAPRPLSFSEMIEARRRAQQEYESQVNAAESAAARGPSEAERAAANLNRNLQSITQQGGTSGVFSVTEVGTRTGSFKFRGWKDTPGSGWQSTYDVDAGPGGNVHLALVRKMISLIREHYQDKFNWDSHRLGHVVVLSAKLEENAGLEAFLMKEFFNE